MATRTVVCPDCSEPLTLGRLSCSNCGSLLASVAGAPRRTRPLRTVVVDEPTWLSDDDSRGWTVDEAAGHDPYEHGEPRSWDAAVAPIVVEAADAPSDVSAHASSEAPVEPAVEPAPADDRPDAVLGEPEAIVDVVEPAEPVAVDDPAADPAASTGVEIAAVDDNVDQETQLSWVDLRVAAVSGHEAAADPDAPAEQDAVESEAPSAEQTPPEQRADQSAVDDSPLPELEPRREESPVEPDIPAADPIAVVPDESPADPPADARPEVTDEPVGAPGDVDDAAEPAPPDVVPAEAVDASTLARHEDEPARPLQPSHTTRSHIDLSDRVVAASPVAAAWPPADDAADDLALESFDEPVAEPPAGAWVPPTADPPPAPAAVAEAAPATSGRRSDLKLDAPDDLPTGFTVVGSGIATLGFLLPWAAAVPSSAGWLDRWGLADASYGLVFLASVLLLGLNVVPNRVPAWVRAGVLPLGLGGLLLGLVWPAMLGAAGMQLGAVAVTLAAFLLVAGGVVGVGRARHEGSQPVV